VLFDLDGVLVDSRECIEQVWREWAAARGRDYRDFLRVAHGHRTSETVALVAPELDARHESAALDAMESVEARGLVAFPGVHALLAAIPSGRWAIVTSGSLPVATLRLGAADIAPPAVFITAGDVRKGKPDPEGYVTAAGRLSLRPSDCVVVEDSPTGIAAGKAAGMRVVAVATTYPPDALAAADVRLPALAAMRVRPGADGTMEMTFA
jgi:sugar-phosphatase